MMQQNKEASIWECVQCGKNIEHPDNVWLPGECCLFNMFYACSRSCALAWVEANRSGLRGFDEATDLDCEPEESQ